MVHETAEKIRNSESIVLTTHRQCDGDGLGSELALYHALKKIGKNARVLNVDETPQKYAFLSPDEHIQYYDGEFTPLAATDLALIFDTNDKRLVEPLYQELENKCKDILFIDHHPVLKTGPQPTVGSLVDTKAASTGELAYDLIKALDIDLDAQIARAIYTSIVFDTQLFRYVRNSPRSHKIAAELLLHEKKPAEVHKCLFGNFTANKLRFIAEALRDLEFYSQDKIVTLLVRAHQLHSLGLEIDDSRDLIDMVMNIESVEAAVLFREDNPDLYKVSLRSKGQLTVIDIAEKMGGGGHSYASGATLQGDYQEFCQQIVSALQTKLKAIY